VDWQNTCVSEDSPRIDLLYKNALREVAVILSAWTVCLVYTVTYCYLYGYLSHEGTPESMGPDIGTLVGPLSSFNRDPESLTTPLGLAVPDWIFYGVVLPWVLCILFSLWFCLFYFREDDLGSEVTLQGDEVPDDVH
jgi:hypothetical protein